MNIEIGQQAPDFTLFNTEKNKVSLTDHSGKNVVILFFPLAFTGVCTAQLCTVRDGISMYKNDKADVVAISVDSAFTLGKFKEEQNLQFDLLSDFNKEAAATYGALYDVFPAMGMKGVARRAAFVIDKNGVIQYAQVLESAGDLPDFAAINATLEKIS